MCQDIQKKTVSVLKSSRCDLSITYIWNSSGSCYRSIGTNMIHEVSKCNLQQFRFKMEKIWVIWQWLPIFFITFSNILHNNAESSFIHVKLLLEYIYSSGSENAKWRGFVIVGKTNCVCLKKAECSFRVTGYLLNEYLVIPVRAILSVCY